MRTFIVHRKKGTALRYQAYGYTEDADAGRIYFHKKEDKSDRDAFVVLGEISGIDEELTVTSLSTEDKLDELLTLGIDPEVFVRELSEMIEKLKQKRKMPPLERTPTSVRSPAVQEPRRP